MGYADRDLLEAREPLTATLQQRADWYNLRFSRFRGSWLTVRGTMLSGMWILGANYRGSGFYGSYPPGYLARVTALFPDVPRRSTLHVFSGSLTRRDAVGPRVDLNPARRPSVVATVYALPFALASVPLTIGDPPYSDEDAKRYGLPMVDRRRVLREVARVTEPGGFLVWLDTVMPMFRKDVWQWCGQIGIVRSTNHRYRMVSLFRRVP